MLAQPVTQGFDALEHVYRDRARKLDAINRVAPWLALHRRRTLEILESILPEHARLLDLASGTGILIEALWDRIGSATLVDILPATLGIAKQKFASLAGPGQPQLSYITADIETLELDPASEFDIILLTQALNFLPDPTPVFELARRHLATGGTLYIDVDTRVRWATIECLSGRPENALAIANSGEDAAQAIIGTRYVFHDLDTLIALASDFGLTVRRVRGICHVSPMLHIFAPSADFLDPTGLDPRAGLFLSDRELDCLYRLDRYFDDNLEPASAGWVVLEIERR